MSNQTRLINGQPIEPGTYYLEELKTGPGITTMLSTHEWVWWIFFLKKVSQLYLLL